MATTPTEQVSAPIDDPSALPPRVAALRLKILEAAGSGDIERLRAPVEWNEIPPLFERGLKKGPGFDPLDALKARSFDRQGAEMLAILKAARSAETLEELDGLEHETDEILIAALAHHSLNHAGGGQISTLFSQLGCDSGVTDLFAMLREEAKRDAHQTAK